MSGNDPEPTAAESVRREVLGDEHVDRALSDPAPEAWEFQEYLMETAWSRWTRDGLGRRERSVLTLGMTAALGRMEEFRIHLAAALRNGVTHTELDEIVLQIVAYCGAPAGVAARRELVALRAAERDGA